jgi:hypothetical protein
MAEKKKVPKHIEEFFEKDKKVDKLVDTTEAMHTEAYTAGLEAIRDKKGQVDYQMLEDVKHQDKMLDKMVDKYMSSAMERLLEVGGEKFKKPKKGSFEEDVFLSRYAKTTRSELKKRLRSAKSNYNLKAHEKSRDDLIKELKKDLTPLRHGHLEKSHIGDILKHTGTAKYMAKENIQNVDDIIPLLDIYKAKGELSLSDLKQIGIPDLYLNEKSKKDTKSLKDNYKKAA